MTTEEKFNYIKNFTTYGLDDFTYFALPIKDTAKEYPTMSDIIVTDGFFLLDDTFSIVAGYTNCKNYSYNGWILEHDTLWWKHVDHEIDVLYNTLIEFENKVKQLNGG